MSKIKFALIVEDDKNWQGIYQRALEEKGIEFLQATTLTEGEELYSSNSEKIQLIIMDGCLQSDYPNTMPLIKKIRETFKGPMIAGSGSDSYLKELVAAGCNFKFDKAGGSFREILDEVIKE